MIIGKTWGEKQILKQMKLRKLYDDQGRYEWKFATYLNDGRLVLCQRVWVNYDIYPWGKGLKYQDCFGDPLRRVYLSKEDMLKDPFHCCKKPEDKQ